MVRITHDLAGSCLRNIEKDLNHDSCQRTNVASKHAQSFVRENPALFDDSALERYLERIGAEGRARYHMSMALLSETNDRIDQIKEYRSMFGN